MIQASYAIVPDFFNGLLVLLSHNVAAFADEESCIWQDSLFSMRGAEMDLPKSGDATSRFLAFVDGLRSVIGHADRAKPLRDYCIGLMMPGERKSVEPMAAITAPERTAAQHQSLLHFVGEGTWSDEKVLAKVREMVLPEIERHGPIEAWIIDDTGFPKKGRHSVGVGRQYCGELGKQDNCQIAVTLSIANHHASLPAAYRLYLPKEWATDRTRRRKAGVPKEITFKTKPAIALEQLRWACVAGLPRGVVLMDAGYGAYTDLRTNITALGLSYVAGIMPQTSVWAPGTGPQPPKAWSGCGRPPKLLRRDGKHQPISVKKLAFGLPSKAWCKITWREATAEPLSSRFARVRVRAAHRDYWLAESRPEEWTKAAHCRYAINPLAPISIDHNQISVAQRDCWQRPRPLPSPLCDLRGISRRCVPLDQRLLAPAPIIPSDQRNRDHAIANRAPIIRVAAEDADKGGVDHAHHGSILINLLKL